MLVLSRKSGEGIVIGAGTPHEVRVVVIEMATDDWRDAAALSTQVRKLTKEPIGVPRQ